MIKLKIKDINSYDNTKKKLAINSIIGLLYTGIDGLFVYLINKNVDNETLRIIGIALFGIGGVKNAFDTLICIGALGYTEVQDIKERLEERKYNNR